MLSQVFFLPLQPVLHSKQPLLGMIFFAPARYLCGVMNSWSASTLLSPTSFVFLCPVFCSSLPSIALCPAPGNAGCIISYISFKKHLSFGAVCKGREAGDAAHASDQVALLHPRGVDCAALTLPLLPRLEHGLVLGKVESAGARVRRVELCANAFRLKAA